MNNKLKINTRGGDTMKTLAKMLVIWCWCMCTFVQAADGPRALKPELKTTDPTQQKITPEIQIKLDYKLKEQIQNSNQISIDLIHQFLNQSK